MKKTFTLSKHILAPKHIKISEKEKNDLLEHYHVSGYELPKIKKNDPAIKNLSAKPGDIIKIIRNSPTALESVFYRVVVDV